MFAYDVIIVGAGVIGSAVARELSRYRLKILVLEKEEDVCSGTTKANSAIVHAGYDACEGSAKARFNVAGSRMMETLSEELDFPYQRNGSMVLCFEAEQLPELEKLLERGRRNGVGGLRILSGGEARELEPALTEELAYALHVPTGGIVCPFLLNIALAENAAANGVIFQMLTRVDRIEKLAEGFAVHTPDEVLNCRFVVNAAGVYADQLHNMVSAHKLHITPRKGEYMLLDKTAGSLVGHTIFQLPGKYGKGVLVTPTVHGNLMIGPNAVDQADKDDVSTTPEGLMDIQEKAGRSVRNIPFRKVITSFAGLRAHEDGNDFVVGECADAPGFFDAAGIESPGLSSAPAIGVELAGLIAERAGAEKKTDFVSKRRGFGKFVRLPKEEQEALIRENPAYGQIICRCEQVTEAEIVEAIHRVPGARSMDGIKRRVRQGMGRCQGGFCMPKAMDILARELKLPAEQVCKNRPGSELLLKKGRDGRRQ